MEVCSSLRRMKKQSQQCVQVKICWKYGEGDVMLMVVCLVKNGPESGKGIMMEIFKVMNSSYDEQLELCRTVR